MWTWRSCWERFENSVTPALEAISWEQCRADFEPDGALRDIYVLRANRELWAKLFDRLRGAYDLSFSVDGIVRTLPASVEEVFALRPAGSPLLNFDVGSIDVACHFFDPAQIEFDILPNQVRSQSDLNELLQFLTLVGNAVGDTVVLTPENRELEPIITYIPQTKSFLYHKRLNAVR